MQQPLFSLGFTRPSINSDAAANSSNSSPFIADENHSDCDVNLPVESEAEADLSVEEWPEAINDDESDSYDLDLDPNDSSSDEREGISSASQTVCMSGTANVDLSHLSAIDGHFDVGNLTNELCVTSRG